jgi:hypothetical protein
MMVFILTWILTKGSKYLQQAVLGEAGGQLTDVELVPVYS